MKKNFDATGWFILMVMVYFAQLILVIIYRPQDVSLFIDKFELAIALFFIYKRIGDK